MRFYPFVLLFVLFSCGSKDQQMCDCLEAGEKLNQLSAELLVSEVTPSQKKEMEALKADKETKCADFQTMGGEEMLKKKAACAQ